MDSWLVVVDTHVGRAVDIMANSVESTTFLTTTCATSLGPKSLCSHARTKFAHRAGFLLHRPHAFTAPHMPSLDGLQLPSTSANIPNLATLMDRVESWARAADKAGRCIHWRFTVHDARRIFRYSALATRWSKH
jgi:hypothetical protein